MFRTAVLRSVARVAARPAAVTRFAVAAAPRAATAVVVPKIQSFQGVRFYSAGGALNKEEVEGRIMSLLQGFDKVSFCTLRVYRVMRREGLVSVTCGLMNV